MSDRPQLNAPIIFVTLLGVLGVVLVGLIMYESGRASLIKEMKNYGCEKVLGYIIK